MFAMLQRLDIQGTGILKRTDVLRGLRAMNVRLTGSELMSVLRVFDESCNARLYWPDFFAVFERVWEVWCEAGDGGEKSIKRCRQAGRQAGAATTAALASDA